MPALPTINKLADDGHSSSPDYCAPCCRITTQPATDASIANVLRMHAAPTTYATRRSECPAEPSIGSGSMIRAYRYAVVSCRISFPTQVSAFIVHLTVCPSRTWDPCCRLVSIFSRMALPPGFDMSQMQEILNVRF